ncbi:aldehyde dehydrogenase family protein [Hirschia litorea]
MGNEKIYPMTYGGAQVEGISRDAVLNPFDLSVVGYSSVASLDQLDDAVRCARKAFESWSTRPDSQRAEACLKIAKVFEDNAQELSRLITQEQGKPLNAGGFGSGFEVGGCIGWCRATSILKIDDKKILDADGVTVIQKSVPMGVIGSITPWNWPLLIAVWHFIPAIRTGNTVIIKPSPLTPLSTLRAVELINEVLPPGVLNVVPGGAEIGAAISSHADIDKVVFTGSTATGRRVMASASENITPCSLELGGNDAAIVLPGAPVAAMAPGLFFGKFINAGQTCGSIQRLYVHESDYEAVCSALVELAKTTNVGDGLLPDTDLGPVQNKAQFEKVREMVGDAIKQGAQLLVGGESIGEGYALTPAILSHCTHDMEIVAKEQFGPALPIVKYSSIDQAIAMANSTDSGLCASVWGTDPDLLQSVSDRLIAGTVYINTHAELNPMVPFGGVKQSGIGVLFGEDGLKSFVNTKILYQRSVG